MFPVLDNKTLLCVSSVYNGGIYSSQAPNSSFSHHTPSGNHESILLMSLLLSRT